MHVLTKIGRYHNAPFLVMPGTSYALKNLKKSQIMLKMTQTGHFEKMMYKNIKNYKIKAGQGILR